MKKKPLVLLAVFWCCSTWVGPWYYPATLPTRPWFLYVGAEVKSTQPGAEKRPVPSAAPSPPVDGPAVREQQGHQGRRLRHPLGHERLRQALDLLVSGRSLQHTLLVKEGMSAAQIGAAIEKLGLGSAAKFMAVVKDPAEVANLKVPGPTLEGYLFPDSYFLPKGMAEEAIAAQMVARFHQVVPDDLLAQGEAIRLNPRQIMAMAALIEKEAKADTERPMVSAVFRNRMRQKKRLESCASVRCALEVDRAALQQGLVGRRLTTPTRTMGYPPEPCNPGLKSIQAALHPAGTKDLFFVVDGQGTQHFSETYEDFLKAKQHYKRLRRGVVEE